MNRLKIVLLTALACGVPAHAIEEPVDSPTLEIAARKIDGIPAIDSLIYPAVSADGAHGYELKLLVFDLWSGSIIEAAELTSRGDRSQAYLALAPGKVLLCLESGAYLADLTVEEGTWSRGWQLRTLPEVIARAGKQWSYRPQLVENIKGAKWALEAPPKGMTCDPRTGRIHWTPTQQQLGRQTTLLRVDKPEGMDSPIRQPIVIHVLP